LSNALNFFFKLCCFFVNLFVILDNCVEFFDFFLNINSREQSLTFLDCHIKRKNTEFIGIFVSSALLASANLLKCLWHCSRHKCREKCGCDSDSFKQIVKNSCKSCFLCFVLCNHPRCCFVNVLVSTGNYLENLGERIVKLGFINKVINARLKCGSGCDEVIVKFSAFTLCRKCAAKIFFNHCNGSWHKVAKAVCKVGVNTVYHNFVRERAVCAECHFTKNVITDSVCAVSLAKYKRVYNIAEWFTHLLTVKSNPTVNRKVLWKRQIESHKHCRPNYSVETHNILCNHMHIGRPEFIKIIISVVIKTKRRNIVWKCVNPHIYNMLIVKSYRNTPLKRSSRHAKVLKTRLDKVVYKLCRTGFRL